MINSIFAEIQTYRFILRPLKSDDVTNKYLDWLSDSSQNRFIEHSQLTLDELKAYVIEKSNKPDILFIGIFNKNSKAHIGNIKFEPVDVVNKIAIMGILIGDNAWKGKGVATEVILECTNFLYKNLGIKLIVLGVNRFNINAIKLYKKIGFQKKKTKYLICNNNENFSMVLDLESSKE